MPPKIGIIAGSGAMPERVIGACLGEGRDVYVLGLEEQADPAAFSRPPDAWIRIGEAGKGISLLKAAGAEDLVMVGGVSRPSLLSLSPDAWTAKFLAKMGRGYLRDGSILNAIAAALEKEGFRVVAPEAFAGGLLAEPRRYGKIAPDEEQYADVLRGFEVVRALGALDIGQAAIVQQGCVIGVEAAEGTDGLIERSAGLLREGSAGVLIKVCKPGQDLRIDLPTIGPKTVTRAARCGLGGIAVEAGRALILDEDAVAEAADRTGLFVVGVGDVG